VKAVLKMIANTASGASAMTKCTMRMHASNTCSSTRMRTLSLPFSVAALTATPKMSAKTINGSMSPSSARTAASNGFRGMSSTSVSATDFAPAAWVRSASTLWVAAV
jgi:hypothetical protein